MKIINLKLVILLEYKNIKKIFAKGYVQNCSEKVFVIKKVYFISDHLISDLRSEEIVGTVYEKELQKTNQTEFRVKKVIKRKDNKLHVKWRTYDSSFKNWIYKKDIV